MSPPTAEQLDALIAAARDVRERFHAPYSGFAVGAAILAGGKIFTGANVENASYPLSVCAERNAVGAMVSAGERRIDAVAVVAGGNAGPVPPCGGCRQVLAEFAADDIPVVSEHADDRARATWTVGGLLPDAFRLSR